VPFPAGLVVKKGSNRRDWISFGIPGPLSDILAGVARREFTAPLYRRCEADGRYREWGLVGSGWGVVALADLDREYGKLEQELMAHPFPPACRGCPKTEGW